MIPTRHLYMDSKLEMGQSLSSFNTFDVLEIKVVDNIDFFEEWRVFLGQQLLDRTIRSC